MTKETNHHDNLSDEEREKIANYLKSPGVSDRRLDFRIYKVVLIAVGSLAVTIFAGWSVEYWLDW